MTESSAVGLAFVSSFGLLCRDKNEQGFHFVVGSRFWFDLGSRAGSYLLISDVR